MLTYDCLYTASHARAKPTNFDPDADEEVWCDVDVDEIHTLEDVHEAIFDVFDRWDAHMYEFTTYDEDGIATRRYAMLQQYSGEQNWPSMDADEIERAISQVGTDDEAAKVKDCFRELQSNPPDEGNAGEPALADLERLQWLHYLFDFGDRWEHVINIGASREGTLDGDPQIVETHGPIPPQYTDPGGLLSVPSEKAS